MLNEIIKIVIGFIFTGVIGSMISAKVQRTSYKNQAKTSKIEKEVEKIKEIARKIGSLSSKRNITARIFIDCLYSKGTDDEKIKEARSDYRESVLEWNSNLQSIYIDLFSNDMYEFALRLESSVHNHFVQSHRLINEKLNNKPIPPEDIERQLSSAFKQTRSISLELATKANAKLELALNGDTEPLSINNINNASSITLLRALFHTKPNSIRIPRS